MSGLDSGLFVTTRGEAAGWGARCASRAGQAPVAQAEWGVPYVDSVKRAAISPVSSIIRASLEPPRRMKLDS